MPTRVCPICSDDHLYRECEHPCIQQYHNLCLEIHISLIVNNRFYRTCEAICYETPPGVARAMILKYTPRDMLSSEFISIQQWRTYFRDTEVENDNKKLPCRVGVISNASKVDLRNMLSHIYSRLADDAYNNVDPNQVLNYANGVPLYSNNIRQASMAGRHATNVATALTNFSRKLKNTINITPSGVIEVISNLQAFLTTTIVEMENNHIVPTTLANEVQTGVRQRHIDTSFIPLLNGIINDGNDPRLMNAIRPYIMMERIAQYSHSILPEGAVISSHSRLAEIRAPPTPPTPPTPPNINRQPNFHVNLSPDLQTELPSTIQGETCGICWEHLTITNACRTDCNHNYCAGCMTEHIRTTRRRASRMLRHAPSTLSADTDLSCPLCRHSITDVTYYSEHDDIITHILDMRIMLDTYTPPNYTPIAPVTPNNTHIGVELLQELTNDVPPQTPHGTPPPHTTLQEVYQFAELANNIDDIFGSDTESDTESVIIPITHQLHNDNTNDEWSQISS